VKTVTRSKKGFTVATGVHGGVFRSVEIFGGMYSKLILRVIEGEGSGQREKGGKGRKRGSQEKMRAVECCVQDGREEV